MCKVRKMCETLALLGLIMVFPVGILVYMYFTVPKFQAGDCFKFTYNDNKTFRVTKLMTYRYQLNNSMYLGHQYVDKNARRVSCE